MSAEPRLFNQSEFNDLVKDLGLPKDSSEILGSRLRAKNLLSPGTSFYFYRNREKEFTPPYFSEEDSLIYCNKVSELIPKRGTVSDVIQCDSPKEMKNKLLSD